MIHIRISEVDKMVKWADLVMTAWTVSINTHLTLYLEASHSNPFMNSGKGSLFSGQLPPPEKLVPGTRGSGSGDAAEMETWVDIPITKSE